MSRKSSAALLQFLPSGLLRRSRSGATSNTVVAPTARAGLSPRVALPSGPWPVLRHRTAWACGEMPDAPRVLSRPSLLPPSPRPHHCLQHPRPILYRAWRWAVSPRVALPSRPLHGERRWTAWLCGGAPNAALLQFLPSGLLPLSVALALLPHLEDRRGADGPGRLEPDHEEGCATIRPMACSTATYCLGV